MQKNPPVDAPQTLPETAVRSYCLLWGGHMDYHPRHILKFTPWLLRWEKKMNVAAVIYNQTFYYNNICWILTDSLVVWTQNGQIYISGINWRNRRYHYEYRQYQIAIWVDLKKKKRAFDTIDHTILIEKHWKIQYKGGWPETSWWDIWETGSNLCKWRIIYQTI